MKTLTIKNPWAYLIAKGIKDVENRSWRTHYRGKLLIHSSAKMDQRYPDMKLLFNSDQWTALGYEQQMDMVVLSLPMSAIIGEVEIVDCIQNSKSVWAEPGQWHWVLKNAKMYDQPILNVKGKLSFWEYGK